MLSGIVRHFPYSLTAVALIAAANLFPGVTAAANPSQDQEFFDLSGQQEILPVDNANSLVTTVKKACSKLDNGMPVGDLVELIRNNGFNENPLRLQPQDRIIRTIDRFINASVEDYCPYDRGKMASIAGYRLRSSAPGLLVLVSYVEPRHTGEIAPTKPLPIPAQPPPIPEEISPPPQQPPPPPGHRVQPVPPQAPPQQAEPPPAAAPASSKCAKSHATNPCRCSPTTSATPSCSATTRERGFCSQANPSRIVAAVVAARARTWPLRLFERAGGQRQICGGRILLHYASRPMAMVR